MKKINFLLTALLFLALFGCDKKDEKIKSNWTLIAQSGDSRWYTDFESMNQKSVGIFSFKELYDTDKEFEAIKDDGRKVKSIIEEKLVNCTDGSIKNGIFTAYTENMGKGLSFEGVSKLDIWMGTVPNTPGREIVMAICHPELKTNLESKQENLSIATNNVSSSEFPIPAEQTEFQTTLKKFPQMPANLRGTREGDAFEADKTKFLQKWNVKSGKTEVEDANTSIANWICIANTKQGETAMNSCHPVNTDSSPVTMLSFLSEAKLPEEKWYKGDVLKISGNIFQSSFGDDFLYQFLLNDAEIEIIKKK